jgi:catechol 2,3-dioxygenase-like lactoylglutathione lyase family enzyme
MEENLNRRQPSAGARATEIRCYIRDPDGHLIEVGQTTV